MATACCSLFILSTGSFRRLLCCYSSFRQIIKDMKKKIPVARWLTLFIVWWTVNLRGTIKIDWTELCYKPLDGVEDTTACQRELCVPVYNRRLSQPNLEIVQVVADRRVLPHLPANKLHWDTGTSPTGLPLACASCCNSDFPWSRRCRRACPPAYHNSSLLRNFERGIRRVRRKMRRRWADGKGGGGVTLTQFPPFPVVPFMLTHFYFVDPQVHWPWLFHWVTVGPKHNSPARTIPRKTPCGTHSSHAWDTNTTREQQNEWLSL